MQAQLDGSQKEDKMQYFYDKTQSTFLVRGIHDIPNGAIEVSESAYQELINGRASGCEIVVGKDNKLSLTTPKPSQNHKWDGKEWTIDKAGLQTLLNARKDGLLLLLANKADELKSSLLVGYPQAEIESFYRQEKEALAWRSDNSAQTPMLTQIAKVRGVPFEILVSKVLEKSDQFAVAIGMIIGKRQAFEDRLVQANTLEELKQLELEVTQWQAN